MDARPREERMRGTRLSLWEVPRRLLRLAELCCGTIDLAVVLLDKALKCRWWRLPDIVAVTEVVS
ncbi:hypothetical protein LTS10_004452 [Elasticomyces elasticus]|nr:hypothetical protein LTS10_004452 [Elasticomyces elasticus]